MRNSRKKWWEKKWYWALSIILPWVLVPALDLLLFPEIPLSDTVVYAGACSVGVYLAYRALMGKPVSVSLGGKKPVFEIQPRTLLRILIMLGGVSIGFFIFTFIVIPLTYYFDIPRRYGPVLLLLMFALMVVWAFILDTIMKRRDYRPFMGGGGSG